MTSDTEHKVIKIEDARELREMGVPILPIVDKEFSDTASKLFFRAEKARLKFYRAFVQYCKAPKPTEQKYKRIREALERIVSLRNEAANFLSADEGEALALQCLLTAPIGSFLAFWEETLTSAEEGETIKTNITREMFDGWTVSVPA